MCRFILKTHEFHPLSYLGREAGVEFSLYIQCYKNSFDFNLWKNLVTSSENSLSFLSFQNVTFAHGACPVG